MPVNIRSELESGDLSRPGRLSSLLLLTFGERKVGKLLHRDCSVPGQPNGCGYPALDRGSRKVKNLVAPEVSGG